MFVLDYASGAGKVRPPSSSDKNAEQVLRSLQMLHGRPTTGSRVAG